MRLDRRILLGFGFGIALIAVLAPSVDGLAADSPEVHIHSLDPSLDVSELGGPKVRLHSASEEPPKRLRAQRKSDLPQSAQRKLSLEQAGLASAVQSWDELALDQLYLRARELPLERLQSLYPELSRAGLEKLSLNLRKAH